MFFRAIGLRLMIGEADFFLATTFVLFFDIDDDVLLVRLDNFESNDLTLLLDFEEDEEIGRRVFDLDLSVFASDLNDVVDLALFIPNVLCEVLPRDLVEFADDVARGVFLVDLFVTRIAVSLSVGVLLLKEEAFVLEVMTLVFLVLDGGATLDSLFTSITGEWCSAGIGESKRSFFDVVSGISILGLALARFLALAVMTSRAFEFP